MPNENSKTSSASKTRLGRIRKDGTPNAPKPMKQLQARIEGKGTMIPTTLDERHLKFLRGIQTFCRNGMHLDPSNAVVVSRALEVYFWMLGDKLIDVRLKEERGELDPDGFLLSFADALYEERIALLTTANRMTGADSDIDLRRVPPELKAAMQAQAVMRQARKEQEGGK